MFGYFDYSIFFLYLISCNVKRKDCMKVSIFVLAIVAGLCLAETIEIGTPDIPSNDPWCGD